jgi:hypothetical protein
MTEPTRDELLALNRAGISYSELAQRFGFKSRNVVAGLVDRSKRSKLSREERLFQRVNLGQPFALKGDFLIVGDVHVPTTDLHLARLVGMVAKKHLDNPRLIIAGDFFNQDSFSKYAPVVAGPSWADERDAGRQLLGEWLDVFSEIHVIMGNHDRRLQKWSAAEFEAADIFGMLTTSDRLHVSNYGWCTVDTPGGRFRVTHSKNYSVNQLAVADALSAKHHCHIISFHEHHLGIGWSRYGHYLLVNGGGLFDVSQMAYVVLDDGKSPEMIPGFVMLKNGTPYLFGNSPFTDWSKWV